MKINVLFRVEIRKGFVWTTAWRRWGIGWLYVREAVHFVVQQFFSTYAVAVCRPRSPIGAAFGWTADSASRPLLELVGWVARMQRRVAWGVAAVVDLRSRDAVLRSARPSRRPTVTPAVEQPSVVFGALHHRPRSAVLYAHSARLFAVLLHRKIDAMFLHLMLRLLQDHHYQNDPRCLFVCLAADIVADAYAVKAL